MMFGSSTSLLFHMLVVVCFLCGSSSCQENITQEILPHITVMPCNNKEKCSLDSFLEDSSNSLDAWMLALYFDMEKYSSRDVVADILPTLIKSLRTHKIIFGRVRCIGKEKPTAAIESFCANMDPSVIYAYLGGKRTEFWWSVSDLLSHRSFVIGNLLTLQYKSQLEMFSADNYKEKIKAIWSQKQPERKSMMAVHVASADLEVNTTDRMKAFDLLGHVIHGVPNVNVAVVTGVIEEGVEFWYLDSVNCPDIYDDEKCKIRAFEFGNEDNRGADKLLCSIEKYSLGYSDHQTLVHLRNSSASIDDVERRKRFFKFCNMVLMVYENELSQELRSFAGDLSAETNLWNFLVVATERSYAHELLSSIGGEKLLGEKTIYFKHLTESASITPKYQCNSTTQTGSRIVIKPHVGKMNIHVIISRLSKDVEKYYSSNIDEDSEDSEFNPYVETDELFLLWSNQKPITSEYFIKLNHTKFNEMTANEASAIVLFYQPWNSACVYSLDLVFPAAANYLQAEHGITDRLYSINCFDYNELCEAEKITRYPIVKVFHGKKVTLFSDTISVKNLVREALLIKENFFTPKTTDEVENILNYTKVVVHQIIIAVGIENEKTLKSLRSAAAKYRGREIVLSTTLDLLPDYLKKDVSTGQVVSYSSRSKPSLIHLKDSNQEDSLERFVVDSRRNRVMELTWDFFKDISTSDRPLLILLVHHMTSSLYCLLSGIATQHTGELYITWMNAQKQLDYIIFKDFKSPELVLRNPEKGAFYRHPISHKPHDDCTKTDPVIEQWIAGVLNGTTDADEFLQEREYPPSGPHINILDEVYPPRPPADFEKQVASSTDHNVPEENRQQSTNKEEMAASIPPSPESTPPPKEIPPTVSAADFKPKSHSPDEL